MSTPEITINWPAPAAGPTLVRTYRLRVRGRLAGSDARAELTYDFPAGSNLHKQLTDAQDAVAAWRARAAAGEATSWGFTPDGGSVSFFDAGGVERPCLVDGRAEI